MLVFRVLSMKKCTMCRTEWTDLPKGGWGWQMFQSSCPGWALWGAHRSTCQAQPVGHQGDVSQGCPGIPAMSQPSPSLPKIECWIPPFGIPESLKGIATQGRSTKAQSSNPGSVIHMCKFRFLLRSTILYYLLFTICCYFLNTAAICLFSRRINWGTAPDFVAWVSCLEVISFYHQCRTSRLPAHTSETAQTQGRKLGCVSTDWGCPESSQALQAFSHGNYQLHLTHVTYYIPKSFP